MGSSSRACGFGSHLRMVWNGISIMLRWVLVYVMGLSIQASWACHMQACVGMGSTIKIGRSSIKETYE